MRGSSTAAVGKRKLEVNGILTPASVSEITATMVTSLPVPAVVGTTNSGLSARLRLCAPENCSRSSPPSETSTLTPLLVSMTEPPPMATMASHWCSRYCAAALRTATRLLSGGTSSNTTAIAVCDALKMDSTNASSPAPRTPLSVMTIGRTMERVESSNGRCSRAASPAMILTGLKNS